MSYAILDTTPDTGFRPGVGRLDYYSGGRLGYYGGGRLGQSPTSTFTIGPDGEWSISAASAVAPVSVSDQVTNWFSQSTILAGTPNIVVAGAAVLFLLLMGGKK